MALDTSTFETDTKALRKAMQEAFKDINAVLDPKPKLNFIMATDKMGQVIIDSIGACIGEENGQPIWVDPKAASLNPDTIITYEYLVNLQTPEPGAEAQSGAEAAAAAAEEIYLAEGEECPGWVKSAGPTNPKYKAICAVCSKIEACKERAKPKTEKAAKEPKLPKEPKIIKEAYSRVHSVCDCLKTNSPFTKESLAQAANALYIQKGGKDNLKESVWAVGNFLKPLILMGTVVEDNGNFQVKA